MSIVGLDHVDIYLSPKNHKAVINFFKETKIGLKVEYDVFDKELDVRVSRFKIKPTRPEGVLFSVMSPVSSKSAWWGQLERWGEGINHTAFRVNKIQEFMDKLAGWNSKICIDPLTETVITKPVPGVEGAQHFHLNRHLTGMWGMQIIVYECKKCRAPLKPNFKYCYNCGESVYLNPSLTERKTVGSF